MMDAKLVHFEHWLLIGWYATWWEQDCWLVDLVAHLTPCDENKVADWLIWLPTLSHVIRTRLLIGWSDCPPYATWWKQGCWLVDLVTLRHVMRTRLLIGWSGCPTLRHVMRTRLLIGWSGCSPYATWWEQGWGRLWAEKERLRPPLGQDTASSLGFPKNLAVFIRGCSL